MRIKYKANNSRKLPCSAMFRIALLIGIAMEIIYAVVRSVPMKTLILVLLITAYTITNFLMAKLYTAKEMRRVIIDGQCTVGMIAANIFYAPAWVLKGVRFVVMATIR